MAQQAISFVLAVVRGRVVYGIRVGLVGQAMRAPFRNPAGHAVIALTDWAVKPLRRVIPGAGGYDWASLVAAYLAEVAWILAMLLIFSSGFAGITAGAALFVLASAAVQLVKAILWLAIAVVILQAVLSWVAPDGPLSGLLNALTFPFLRPLRRVIPPIGGTLDLTPLVLIVILQLALMIPVRWLEGAVIGLLR